MAGNSIDKSKDSDGSLEGTSKEFASVLPSSFDRYDDDDDVDDDYGTTPSQLYGRYTWEIDKFSQLNKREVRSNSFEIGGYKWCILVYPQGCDVCDHLSLFLCVAKHDKLLPGWNQLAQFTVAVVNKDPKLSKYSDTLHRFWKKEHDWGWKKFMESSKLLEGSYVDADTLIIKIQVQVIRDRNDGLFRCLDLQYRRELVRVYSSNVEQLCHRFMVQTRGKLQSLVADRVRWSCFRDMWLGFDEKSRHQFTRMKLDLLSKLLVKHFFIEKEVTSTLLMDLLYFGLSTLTGQTKSDKVKGDCVVRVEGDTCILIDDVFPLFERVAVEPLPPKHDNDPHNRTKDGEPSAEDIEKDERRLVELGQRVIESYVLFHISSKIEVVCQEALALKIQEELIREEENDREKAKATQKQKPKPKLKRAS